MQYCLLIFIFFISSLFASAQPDAIWAHRLAVTDPIFSFGKNLSVIDMETDETGNIYLLGFHRAALELDGDLISNNYDGAQTAFLMKFSPEGSFLWQRLITMGIMKALDYHENALYIGGEIVPAEFGPLMLEPGPSGQDVGNLFANGHRDAFIARYDTDGNLSWAHAYGGADGEALDKGDYLNDLKVGNDGTIYFTGSFHQEMIFDEGHEFIANDPRDLNNYIAALSPEGVHLWSQYWPSTLPGNAGNTYGSQLAISSQGSIYQIIGYTSGGIQLEEETVQNGFGGSDGFVLVNYTSGGNISWYANAEAAEGLILPSELATDGSGHIYLTYNHTDDVKLTDHTSLYFQTDDGLLKTGVARFDQTGNLQWANSYFCSDASMVVAADGSAYFNAALFRNDIWLSPYTHLEAASPGTTNIWFQLKGTGALAWARLQANADAPMLSTNHAITIDEEEYIYATGTFNEHIDFGNGWALDNGYETPDFDALFFVKFDKDALASTQTPTPSSPTWYFHPNPSNGLLQVEVEHKGHFYVYAPNGIAVYNQQLIPGKHKIDLNNLPNGIYLLQYISPKGVHSGSHICVISNSF